MRRNVITVIMTILALVLLVGCGASTNVTTKKLDPTQLLTKSDAQEALGKPVKDAVVKENPTGKVCVYIAEDDNGFIQIALQDKENAVQIFNDLKTNLKGTPSPGIGDDAFWAVPGLHVLKGKVYFSIATGKNGIQELNTKLAKSVLSRM